jgi:4-hydroxy-3-methylbut-2-en-1-yl diphosphate reductase
MLTEITLMYKVLARGSNMRVLRAQHLGMCFGVRDAIALAFTHGESAPLTVLGDLVHNEAVLAGLQARGIAVARNPLDVKTNRVLVTAHGASERTLARVRALGLETIEATCPLVHVAHQAVRTLVCEGYHPVIVGQRDHVEVRGLTEDLETFDVVLHEQDVRQLEDHPRLGVAAQTTQPIDRVSHLVALMRQRFPQSDVRFIDTVCYPTKQRQSAAIDLARQCDVVIVVGGENSNNTRELVNTCRDHCSHVHHIQTESDIRSEWVVGTGTVGVTAGTSTPGDVIDRVERQLRALEAEQPAASHGASSHR